MTICPKFTVRSPHSDQIDDASSYMLRMRFDNSYARDMQGMYVKWQPARSPAPRLLQLNEALATELGLDLTELKCAAGLAVLSGNLVPPGAEPLAQAYAGHQFGGFVSVLGDSRSLLMGELIDPLGVRRDIAYKGAGRTPFSRGDGRATLASALREYLMCEAMHALGIPTTRVLAVVSTGETVKREQAQAAAVITRVASSHLRVGTLEYVAARKDAAALRVVADYAIARHDPDLVGTPTRYERFLENVVDRQAKLVASWMGVGFVHGLLNTDNVSISGETLGYNVGAFLDSYDPDAVFNAGDPSARYAFGQQPEATQWNLARFAETLLPLIDASGASAAERASAVIDQFPERFSSYWREVLAMKLGVTRLNSADHLLATDFLILLHKHRVDYTRAFRYLTDAAVGNSRPLVGLFGQASESIRPWLSRWLERTRADAGDVAQRLASMRHANPAYIPRNHEIVSALSAATARDDLEPFRRLLTTLQRPFDEIRDDGAETANSRSQGFGPSALAPQLATATDLTSTQDR